MAKVVLITGISSGFGNKTAELLASKGYIVYGTVRKETETLPNIHVLKMDLLDPSSIKKAVGSVVQKEGRIDILINNAGVHTGGSIETTPIENIRLQMDTNVMGMVYMLREVLPAMRQQQEGTIINFSSIGGLMGLPFQGFYSASKFAIEGISEALRMELKPFNIKVVVINPGDFHTNNTANRRNYLTKTINDPYTEQFAKSLSIIEKDENGGWPPEVLARKLVKIIETKNPCQRYIIATAEQKLAVMLKRILPSAWFMKILAPHYGIK
jgi:NADP-dependent 3-hydroxy acid dehydrogenase YdfG